MVGRILMIKHSQLVFNSENQLAFLYLDMILITSVVKYQIMVEEECGYWNVFALLHGKVH